MKKRTLSFLLALSCVLSLSAPALAADATTYTDAKDITCWEAVATLSSLGIVEGKDTGAFDPTAFVTRAEAAKLLTLMAFGGTATALDPVDTPTFTDSKGHWAEKEIEYCAGSGIVLGRGNGVFCPDDNVTGTEFAKMCLGLLGYEADVYGLTGSDWAISTNALANFTSVRLYDSLLEVLDPNEALTREQAAQMLYNVLKAIPMVKAPTNNVAADGTVTFSLQKATNSDGTPMNFLDMKFGLKELPTVPAQPGK